MSILFESNIHVSIELQEVPPNLTVPFSPKTQRVSSNVYGNGHTSLYLDMIKAIKENRKPYVDGYAGRNALEIVLAIYKSQLSGQPVKLPLEDFSSTDMVGYFDKDINR